MAARVASEPTSGTRALALATLAYVLGWTAHVTFIFFLAPVALRAAGHTDADALVFSGTAVASILAALPSGRIVDAWPRRRALRLALVLLALAYVPLLGPPTLAGVLVATAVTGVGLALHLVAFNTYVAELSAASGMVGAYARATAGGVLMGAIGPFVAAGIFGLIPSDALAIQVNATLFGIAAGAGALVTLRLPHAAHVAQARVRLADAWRGAAGRALLPAVLAWVIVGAGSGMASPYFAVYFLDHVEAGEATWGVLLGFGTAASALGSLALGAAAKRITPRRLLVPPQIALALTSLAFLAPLGIVMLGAAYVARSLFVFAFSPALNATLMSRIEPTARGRAQAWANLAWNVGWAVGAAAGAPLLAATGGAAFVVGGALALLGAIVAATWMRPAATGA